MSSRALPFGLYQHNMWPTGKDGPLTVLLGQTVVIPHGAVRDYSSVLIAAGGTLKIGDTTVTDDYTKFTVIGCKGTFVNAGTINCRNIDSNGLVVSNFSTPDSKIISANQIQQSGAMGEYGLGGNAGKPAIRGGSGGLPALGHGGGGGGGGIGGGYGGDGGMSGGAASTGRPGGAFVVGPTVNHNGFPGSNVPTLIGGLGGNGGGGGGGGYVDSVSAYAGGGGGGGGYRGYHGGLLYIFAGGGITNSGTFNASGANGLDGGTGGVPYPTSAYATGGIGGGGAGGNGGVIYVKTTIYNGSAPNISAGFGGGYVSGVGVVANNGLAGSFTVLP